MIKLKKTDDFIYRPRGSVLNYLVAYDHSAGIKNRYTVMILNADDPVIIGRELPTSVAKSVIGDCELLAHTLNTYDMYTGKREWVLKLAGLLREYRKEHY